MKNDEAEKFFLSIFERVSALKSKAFAVNSHSSLGRILKTRFKIRILLDFYHGLV